MAARDVIAETWIPAYGHHVGPKEADLILYALEEAGWVVVPADEIDVLHGKLREANAAAREKLFPVPTVGLNVVRDP